MPLLDHFHPPLSDRRHWDSFHGAWAEAMALLLNQELLPAPYFAEARIKLGRLLEIDVATMEERNQAAQEGDGGVAVWAPPRPTLKAALHFTHPDLFEVQVLEGSEGPRLVAAIELVSPANKDRSGNRHAFAVKCASYLQAEVGLVVVDVVTERLANLHRELLNLLQVAAAEEEQEDGHLYAVAYRTAASGAGANLEAWVERLAVGAALPTLPLWIAADRSIPLDLEQTYQMACVARRIG
jgi:hypothetical protein